MPIITKTTKDEAPKMAGMIEHTTRAMKREEEMEARVASHAPPAYSGMPVPPANKRKLRNVYVEGIHRSKKLVEDTLVHTKQPGPRAVHLEGVIVSTTGDRKHHMPVNGIITQTTRGDSKIHDSVMKYHGHKAKTQPETYGQVPYAGPKY